MARLHPGYPLDTPLGAGAYRERDILRQLLIGLPDSFDVFHQLGWSTMLDGQQGFGEYDMVVVAPGGGLLILEIKAGEVRMDGHSLTKVYGDNGPKDVAHQMRRLHASLLQRMNEGALPQTPVGALLVLPDVRIQSDIVAYPRERILDAEQVEQLCTVVRSRIPAAGLDHVQRQRLIDFLDNRFQTLPDVACHIGQVQQLSTRLANGLATWVPRIRHADQMYRIQATAGSGKTQLALRLLRDAAAAGHHSLYVCYNRPLADHLAQLAPPSGEVTTFHQLCRDHAERQGLPLDFSSPQVYEQMTTAFLEAAPSLAQRLDLLIVDESQDFDASWVAALSQLLRTDGRLYVMGDRQQQLYPRDDYDLPGAVHIDCMDNFRSPHALVQLINRLQLTPDPVQARGPHAGNPPGFHIWEAGKTSASGQLEACLQQLWNAGYTPDQVAVVSWRGLQQSQALRANRLGGQLTRRFTGQYDSAGNPQWTDGSLLVDSLYRFKGQSAPAVVLCEIDAEEWTEREQRKLFVGITRAQMRLELVMSERMAQMVLQRL